MRRFAITQSDTATLTSHAGLALVGQGLRHTRLDRDLAAVPLRHGIAHADCVRSYVGLLTTAKSDFDAIENRREDDFFRTSLGLTQVPSAPSLRQRFDDRAEAFIPHVDDGDALRQTFKDIGQQLTSKQKMRLPDVSSG